MTKVREKTSSQRRLEAKPDLLRQLGIVSATALVISNMVGTGIFTSTGFLAGDLGEAWIVVGIWAVGAVIALAGALCYSELGINLPASGGEYVYLTRAYGPTWGFMTGWISFFAGFSAPIAAAAIGCADYLGHFWPALRQDQTFITLGSGALSFKIGGGQLAASGLILLFTVLNLFGVSRIAKIQNVLTAIKLLVIIAFVVLAFAAGTGNWAHFSQPATRTSQSSLPIQFALSLFWVYVGYSGWNAATYVAEELKRPERTLPIALALGTVVVAVLYAALNVVFIYSTPLDEMKGVVAVGSLAARNLFGPEIAGTFSALMALSLVATVSAMVTIGPRVYYAMAKNGAFVKAAARVHPRWHTPVFAIVCQGCIAVLMTLTPFRDLVTYIGFTLTLFAVLAVASLFVFRRQPGWQKTSVISFAWPLIPVLFILVGTWTLVVGLSVQPRVSLTGLATVAVGALVYHFRIRPGRNV
jgi:APA family basic amino acid/polyamine antiporter